ncbi:MAG: Ig-like domain-containing protein, partial [Rhodoferax sp.]|nr:Ig-like domain-containing protein [Rhodoferax sp.]
AQAVTLAASDIGNSGNALHDGTINVSAVATNAALVSSSATPSSFNLDTIKPNAPSLPEPAHATGGVSRAEALSSVGVLTLTAESGSTVRVTFSDSNNHLVQKTLIGTGSAQPLVLLDTDLGTGSSALGEGTITVTAIATDAAGNSSLVGSNSFTLDSIAPTLPALTGLAFSQDTAANGANNSDFITKVPSQSITATLATSLAIGETLRGSVDGGNTWVNLTGQLTSGTQLSWTADLLTGKNQLLFKVTDAAGNDSAITTQAYELDQSAPTQLATTLALSADTAAPEASSTNTDFITRTASQTISASLSAALGSDEALWGSLDGGTNWVQLNTFVTGTSLSWTGASLLAGTNTLLLKVSDKAGNNGTVRSQAYEVDTTAPTTAIATVGFSNDTGRSSSDLITNQASQIIQGTLNSTVQAGETVYVSVNGGSVWLPASSTVGSSIYSLAGATLVNGTQTLLIKVTDVAGNSGPVSTRTYTLDTSAPNPPALLLGSGVADGATADEATASTGVITVTAESGASVVVTFSDGNDAHAIVKTVTATGSAQPVTLEASEIGNGKLQDGPITVTASATDTAGNVGTNSTSFTLDTQPDTPLLALGTGVSDGATLLEATQASGVATVRAKSGATVRVTFTDGTPAHNRTLTLTATGSAQPLTLDTTHIGTGSNQLQEGTITVRAISTDSAGNSSPEVSTTFTLDTIAPANPVLAVIPTVATGGASRAEATDSTGVLTVNAELLATVRLTFSNATQSLIKTLIGTGSALAVTLAAADLGNGSNQLQDGPITVTATATDVAGNPGTSTNTGNTATFTLDTRAPEAPLIVLGADVQAGATLADAVQSSGVVLVSAEAGSTVNLTFSNGTQSVIRQFTGTGSAQAITLNASDIGTGSNQLQDGTITVTASATDAAGNSSTSTRSSFVLDTRYATTQLLGLGSGVAGFTVASEATQSSGVVTLDAESGSTVWVTFTDANNTSIIKTLVGSGTPGQAVSLIANDIGSFANQLHDGSIKVTATGIDRAGNVSTAFTSFVLDTLAPAQANVVLRQKPAGVFDLAGITSPLGLFQFNTEPGASVRAEFTSTNAGGSVSTFSKTYAYNDSLAGTAPWQAATLAESDIG